MGSIPSIHMLHPKFTLLPMVFLTVRMRFTGCQNIPVFFQFVSCIKDPVGIYTPPPPHRDVRAWAEAKSCYSGIIQVLTWIKVFRYMQCYLYT